jgi:LL-diaminopimelate aminotransferase
MKRNPFFSQISETYLFSEIKSRIDQFQKTHPSARLISLGSGDTTEPLGVSTASSISQAAEDLKNPERYTGYGPAQGFPLLREKISSVIYLNAISSDEIFISDGVKSDIARLCIFFGPHAHIAVQDPSYPAYADSVRLTRLSSSSFFSYLPALPPDRPSLKNIPHSAVIILCSPNNPTGEAYTREDLQALVHDARKRHQLIVFDTAYQAFIQGDLPRSIYEIKHADEVAIEVGSFSKMAGFCGVRLGWTVIPRALKYDDGRSIHRDYLRLISTLFNGASILSQKGGIQALSPEGQKESEHQICVYRENTRILLNSFVKKRFPVWGGQHAPFIWVKAEQKSSWDAFDYFLHKAGVIVMPGVGFGPSGEGYIRVCGFGNPAFIREAASRISSL